jgi:hypothetical protein
VSDTSFYLRLLSEVVLAPHPRLDPASSDSAVFGALHGQGGRTWQQCSTLSRLNLEALGSLAASNHVVLRFFEPLRQILIAQGKTEEAEWAARAIERERARIEHALDFL